MDFSLTHDSKPFMFLGNDLDAIAMIIAGPAARNPTIVNVLKSIRTNGKWEGPIYVLTDSINCLAKIKFGEQPASHILHKQQCGCFLSNPNILFFIRKEVEFTTVEVPKLSRDNVHVEASMLKVSMQNTF